ncbi:MAG: siderophore synthetase [Actinomycetota bacterium]|nr:siderophore synthetase [Actinomycetota bacterium]
MTVTNDRAQGADPLRVGSARAVAEHAHLEALLRCWTRETGMPVQPGPLQVALPATGLTLVTDVRYASITGWHRFGPVRLQRTDGADAGPADPVLAVALVATEAIARGGVLPGGIPPGELADLVERTADSVRRVAAFLAGPGAGAHPSDHPCGDAFLDAEQALLLGHLHHPAPKNRDGITPAEAAAWSPELRGSFRLHWFAADPAVVSQDAVPDCPALRGRDTAALFADLAEFADDRGRVLVPAHPWQARDVLHRPRVAALVEAGLLQPLGERGAPWHPTSSVRTVYRPGTKVMLKLSLGLRITNSRRELTRNELRRGVEMHRLLDLGYLASCTAAHPSFSIVRDPGWLAVDEPQRLGGPKLNGLDVVVREVPEQISELRTLVGLVAPRPQRDLSRLGELVTIGGLDPAAWVAAYTDLVLVPMLHLYAATGIGLEAHQQNTLVRIAQDGQVVGGAFRDNEGYYLAASRLPELLRARGTTVSALMVVEDRIVEDRMSYYLLRNQAMGVVGCLAVDGLAAEPELLDALAGRLRAALPGLAAAGPDGDRLARRWLTAATLPCKGNLFTRLHGIDEVQAPLDAQSVYLDIPNPLVNR